MRFASPVTNLSRTPDPASTTISQGLYGEHIEVRQHHGDYLHVRNWRDDYEGYVPAHSLVKQDEMSTHFVSAASTLAFARPDIKWPSPLCLKYGSELVIRRHHDSIFSETDAGLYVLRDHCLPMGTTSPGDLVSVAEKLFLGVPYLWGGRSVDGFDCSGLVQMSAYAAGVLLPRDSGMQEAFLTTSVSHRPRRRADFVFWPGHVGLMVDEQSILHATAHSMLSVVEPLDAVISRAGPVSSVKRL